MSRKIAIAISGASGSIYAKLLLEKLISLGLQDQVAVVYSSNAKVVWQEELGDNSFKQYGFKTYAINDYYAPFASGSSDFDTLIIVPCSMGTLGRIASGISDNLISRAADVMLKERRKLICVVRESPYSLVHLRNMTTVTEAGGIILPASPSYYSKPIDINALAMTIVERILKIAQIDNKGYKWGGDDE